MAQVKQLETWLANAISVPFVHITEGSSQRDRFFLEVPNKGNQKVRFSELVGRSAFQKKGEGAMLFGVDTDGEAVTISLKELPHLLVAGNSGKENERLINTLISSLVMGYDTRSLQIVLIDTKQTAFYLYKNCPHLLAPVVSDVGKAVLWLQWLDAEVEERVQRMTAMKARGQNAVKGKKQVAAAPPTIFVVINELADLVVEAKQVVAETIKRIARNGGPVGVHMVIGTQCPSETVIPEVLRSSLTSQCIFHTATRAESVMLLGRDGAEKLMGAGDGMLRLAGGKHVTRVYIPTIRNRDIWKRWKGGNRSSITSEKFYNRYATKEWCSGGATDPENNKPP